MKISKLLVVLLLFSLFAIGVQAQESEYNLDETYAIGNKATIHLNSNDAEVKIVGSDRSDVHLVVYRRIEADGWRVKSEGEFSMEVENRGGDLYIREDDTDEFRVLFGSVREEYRITIEAPRDVALDLQGDDDTYTITDINLGIKLSADDTEVELKGKGGDSFDFDIDDGSIRMEKGRGSLTLTMDDGEFYVRNAAFTEVNAEYDDGRVDMTTTLDSDGFYLFDLDDGDVEMNIAGGGGQFDIHHDDKNISVGNNFEETDTDEDRSIYRLAGGNARIEIDTDDGDIDLRTL